MKVLIAPDSFKGGLSAEEVAQALARGWQQGWSEAHIQLLPLADGGEGTLNCLHHALGGDWRWSQVAGPEGDLREVAALRLGHCTVLEAAQVVGWSPPCRLPLEQRSSRGLGEQLWQALEEGAQEIWIGLGGTSVQDGGAGMLAALGAKLFDAHGRLLTGTLADLERLAEIDWSGLDSRLSRTRLTILCDVNNPLCGPQGAAAIFGPQKGLAPARIDWADSLLRRWANFCEYDPDLPGSGAAGGLGFAFRKLGASLQPGAAFLLEKIGLEAHLTQSDLVLTGEGRTDSQTLCGKLPWTLAKLAQRHGVPIVLISGALETSIRAELLERFTGCFALPDRPALLEECLAEAPRWLELSAQNLAQLYRRLSFPSGD